MKVRKQDQITLGLIQNSGNLGNSPPSLGLKSWKQYKLHIVFLQIDATLVVTQKQAVEKIVAAASDQRNTIP